MKPSDALHQHRNAIRAAARRYRTANPRVFGSTASAQDHEGSDLDLLVDPLPDTTLFDLGALQIELEEILGVPVDVRVPGDLPERVRARVLAQARAI
jgi:predicted nucleotidyltransferase